MFAIERWQPENLGAFYGGLLGFEPVTDKKGPQYGPHRYGDPQRETRRARL